jgi:hypothetical protein
MAEKVLVAPRQGVYMRASGEVPERIGKGLQPQADPNQTVLFGRTDMATRNVGSTGFDSKRQELAYEAAMTAYEIARGKECAMRVGKLFGTVDDEALEAAKSRLALAELAFRPLHRAYAARRRAGRAAQRAASLASRAAVLTRVADALASA